MKRVWTAMLAAVLALASCGGAAPSASLGDAKVLFLPAYNQYAVSAHDAGNVLIFAKDMPSASVGLKDLGAAAAKFREALAGMSFETAVEPDAEALRQHLVDVEREAAAATGAKDIAEIQTGNTALYVPVYQVSVDARKVGEALGMEFGGPPSSP